MHVKIHRLLALAALVFVQVSFAGYFVLSKVALDSGLSPFVFALLRDCGGAVVLQTVTCAKYGFRAPAPAHMFAFVILGMSGVYFGQFLPAIALDHISALNVSLLQPVSVVTTFAFSVFLGMDELRVFTRRGAQMLLALVLAVGGAATVIGLSAEQQASGGGGGHSRSLGDLVLGNAFILLQVSMSAVFVTAQKALLSTGYPPIAVTAWFYTCGAVMVACAVLPTDVLTSAAAWEISGLGGVAIAYAVFICSATNYALLAYGIKYTSPGVTVALTTLQPVAAAVFSSVFLGRQLTAFMAVGGVAIIAGLLLIVWTKAAEWGASKPGPPEKRSLLPPDEGGAQSGRSKPTDDDALGGAVHRDTRGSSTAVAVVGSSTDGLPPQAVRRRPRLRDALFRLEQTRWHPYADLNTDT